MIVEVLKREKGTERVIKLGERGDFLYLGDMRVVYRKGKSELVPVYAENPFEGDCGLIILKYLWGNKNEALEPRREQKISLSNGEKVTVRVV